MVLHLKVQSVQTVSNKHAFEWLTAHREPSYISLSLPHKPFQAKICFSDMWHCNTSACMAGSPGVFGSCADWLLTEGNDAFAALDTCAS